MEFHISRKARNRYHFDESLFSYRGNVIFANFHSARIFAQQLNSKLDLKTHPSQAVQAGQVNAMGLIDEIFHAVISQYRKQKRNTLNEDLLAKVEKKVGKKKLNAALSLFTREFPPLAVYKKTLSLANYLSGMEDGVPNRAAALEELLMLWLSSSNPAFHPYNELFDDSNLKKSTAYLEIIDSLHLIFEDLPFYGPDNQNLVDMLKSPALAVPDSLKGQLDYIRSRWGDFLGHYLLKLLGTLNMISEEENLHGLGPGPVRVPVYSSDSELGSDQFSPDADWMPNLVMIAKNTYVWLNQLSKKYQRSIYRLDQIPDEELDQLSEWGFNGLWLIGLWERSQASAQIKQLSGNPEAIASAYSLKEYRIADELGGEAALQILKEHAQQRGIRLASDMVPNHMAIDSDWVINHPDWFISLPYSPFPSYSFKGPNLSEDKRGSINIEDHYYDRSDAAVVYKYFDHEKNKTYFIYHGNDGTSMPWNDTAQLDYLNPQVREAVIQTILDVARRFPIIRFDAAMTLAKRHYQRLWYPIPGEGSGIPSRSDFSMSRDHFNNQMPEEFWREVVDRVAKEIPGTLLLAEAFWLMEGYFVRTLGMHRVYNSAFMNLLRDEDNAKYRQVMKNTLEFDPEILKRFVNFMNNPDEDTAAKQFGKEDKYFGICTLMVTMPGLPMFGHGQIEGLTEKYGMEYKRAYWDELPDQQLIERHAWQIFPLLKNRNLFSGVERFYLYDFLTPEGIVDENVFVFSNCSGDERALVVFHNRFYNTSGWIKTSTDYMDKNIGVLRKTDLSSGLNLPKGKQQYIIFRDQLSGQEYIRNCAEITKKGIFIQLEAYRAQAFTDFRIVENDKTGIWSQLYDHLNGQGTSDIREMYREFPLRSILKSWREIANPGYFRFLLDQDINAKGNEVTEGLLNEAVSKMENLINGVAFYLHAPLEIKPSRGNFRKKISSIFHLEWLENIRFGYSTKSLKQEFNWFEDKSFPDMILALVCMVFMDCLRNTLKMQDDQFIEQITQWHFFSIIESAYRDLGLRNNSPVEFTKSITFLLKIKEWQRSSNRQKKGTIFRKLLEDDFISDFFKINEFGSKKRFDRERAGTAFFLLEAKGLITIMAKENITLNKKLIRMEKLAELIMSFKGVAEKSGYDLNRFLELLDQI